VNQGSRGIVDETKNRGRKFPDTVLLSETTKKIENLLA
jgi:hypothetical protein